MHSHRLPDSRYAWVSCNQLNRHADAVLDLHRARVLTSDREDGVQAVIVGYIKLDKPGLWKFAVNSNDGVRLMIGGKKIYELPGGLRTGMVRPLKRSLQSKGRSRCLTRQALTRAACPFVDD